MGRWGDGGMGGWGDGKPLRCGGFLRCSKWRNPKGGMGRWGDGGMGRWGDGEKTSNFSTDLVMLRAK
ncbi:MAG: hypothetical protein AAF915_18580 [Cyanobacteria bacterium P01_D01_bin.50]